MLLGHKKGPNHPALVPRGVSAEERVEGEGQWNAVGEELVCEGGIGLSRSARGIGERLVGGEGRNLVGNGERS